MGLECQGSTGPSHQRINRCTAQITHLPPLKLLAAGQGHVLVSDGSKAWGWGDNRNGQLGDAKAYETRPVVLSDSTQKQQTPKRCPHEQLIFTP